MIKMPDHPRADSHGYVKEHILVKEIELGRYLRPDEIVHHKNGVKSDNRPDNLGLFSSHSEHIKMHNDNKTELDRWLRYAGILRNVGRKTLVE